MYRVRDTRTPAYAERRAGPTAPGAAAEPLAAAHGARGWRGRPPCPGRAGVRALAVRSATVAAPQATGPGLRPRAAVSRGKDNLKYEKALTLLPVTQRSPSGPMESPMVDAGSPDAPEAFHDNGVRRTA